MDLLPKCIVCALSLAILVIFSTSFAYGASSLTASYDSEPYRVLTYGEPLILQCNASVPMTGHVIKWLKNGRELSSSEDEKPNFSVQQTDYGSSLTIHRAMEKDVANYTCELLESKSKLNVSRAEIIVLGKPYVKLQDTATVIEGEKLTLECVVLGNPRPVVEWKIGNTSSELDPRVKLTTGEPKESPAINNTLVLEPARMSDRGNVSCSAFNDASRYKLNEDTMVASCYVRVKDKYSALWPFLGIVAEVILLCTVIFIYEKKRNTSELDESDTDQSPEQKNTAEHGKDAVRHRK